MSKPIIISKDFPVQGLGQIDAPSPAANSDSINTSSSTGKFPAPLADNPVNPARIEQNRIVALKHAQHPRR